MIITNSMISDFRIHPLGFYYITLEDGEITRRIHVYGGNSSFSADNEWHTHEFDLLSSIIVGSIQNHIGEFITGGKKSVQEFSVSYGAGNSNLNQTGRHGYISEVVNFTSTAGESYFIKAGIIHRAKPLVNPCVTDVRMTRKGCGIFSYGGVEAPFTRRRLNDLENLELSTILSQNGLILEN
jgi:hypothetical protein